MSFHRLASGPQAAALLVVALGAPGLAQLPDPPLAPETSVVLARSVGLVATDNGASALGPDYKALFDARGFTFTPALGAAVETNRTLRFELAGAARGGEEFFHVNEGVSPRIVGDAVHYAHDGLLERYEVGAEGLHQSFVLDALPPGEGDLVLRGSLTTNLGVLEETPDGGLVLRDTRARGAGISIGAVTGIDASGATVAGTLRVVGGNLELVLPGAFVSQARLPLVVDPLIGAVVDLSVTVLNDGTPDLAYSEAGDAYLLVWTRRFSVTDVDVRGRRLNSFGVPLGSVLGIETGSLAATQPAVASLHETGRFGVVWQEGSLLLPTRIKLCSVEASTGSVSAAVLVESSSASQSTPDIGGERGLGHDDVVIVWREGGLGIVTRSATLTPAGSVFPHGVVVTVQADGFSSTKLTPAISRSSGNAGRFLVTWRSEEASGLSAIEGRAMSRTLTLLGSLLRPSLSFTPSNNFRPDCDGDGTDFVIVWDREEAIGSGVHDIVCRRVSLFPSGIEFGPLQEVEADPGDDENTPSIGYFGQQYVVAYQEQDPSSLDVYAKSIDPFQCTVCEDTELLAATGADERNTAIASRWSGGEITTVDSDEGLIAWEADGNLRGRRYESPFSFTNLFGDCGAGGQAFAPCARAGNADFRVQVRAAAPSAPAVLIAAFAQQPIPCGPCVLWPRLTTPMLFSTATSLLGNASVSIPLPPGASGFVTVQWAVFGGTTCPLLGGFDLSKGLRFEIL